MKYTINKSFTTLGKTHKTHIQLRRSKAMNDDVIIVYCFGMRQRFTNRLEAIQRFYNAMENCNNKVEYDSYSKIFCQLMEGKSYCSDN